MKRIITFLFFIQVSLIQYGQIIADHTVVDKYDDIPQYYINEVKKMWLSYAGESHTNAIRIGLTLLESANPVYAVSQIASGTPEPYTTSNLRVNEATWGSYRNGPTGWVHFYGEQDWYTSAGAIAQTKASLDYCATSGPALAAFGFGWCYDPDYMSSAAISSYLSATQQYIDHCASRGYPTKVFFSTGPMDDYAGLYGYNNHLRWKQIRDYVAQDGTRILFDYADILCWSNAGVATTQSYNSYIYPAIVPANYTPVTEGHISNIGSVRLAKAMWWMLARMAGWDGGTSSIPVTGITVTGAGGSTQITSDNGTLQLTAAVLPTTATNKAVTWSVVNGTGQATINSTGLVTAVTSGTVTARATANDGSGIFGTLVITITNQTIPVTGITVTGAGGSTQITSDNGTLQLTAAVLPTTATNKAVTWSVVNGTGQATISSTGLVTAVTSGTVTARATANDGSGIFGTLVITITNQTIPVTGITVTGAGGSTQITSDNGTLQLTAAVLPTTATNKAVTWSVVNGTGQATISSTGLVTAVTSGTVTARATANDGSGIFGTLVITITNQTIPVTGITVTGAGGSTQITSDNGTLQLTAAVSPTTATNKAVTWSVVNGTGQATISSTGLVTAVTSGTVTARATANDGSGIFGTLVITITNQTIPVTGITVTGAGGSTQITSDNGTLQLTAAVSPTTATNKAVTWSVVNGTGQATISSTGLVTAVTSGTVTARATANDGSGIFGTLVITITNQTIPVTGITVTGAGGSTQITSDNGTLQLTAAVSPTTATNKAVTWSVVNGTGQATISSTGLVTAVTSGTVTARATANDGSGIFGTLVITITNQTIPVTGITVTGAGGSTQITSDNGTLQLTAAVLPTTATTKAVTWSVVNGTGQATINSTGLVTAVTSGTVTARATANDGNGVYGVLIITIESQFIPVSNISVTGEGGVTSISIDDGKLQLIATVLPSNATNKSVIWSLESGIGHAEINSEGLLTAFSNGKVTVRATAKDGSVVFGQTEITISKQIVRVSDIKIKLTSKSSLITSVGGTLTLEAIISPIEATIQSVTWSIINNTGQATVNEKGLVTAISEGTVTARATANDGTGVFGEFEINIEFIRILRSKNELRILVPEPLLPSRISLYNYNGGLIETTSIEGGECLFDTSLLPPGVYLVVVHNSVILATAKTVITN